MSAGDRRNASEKTARAEDYVLGLMDESQRRRAERDMEIDPAFRECVLDLAHRLQRLRAATEVGRPAACADPAWDEIAARLAALPQMTGVPMRPPRRPLRRRAVAALAGRPGLVLALAMAAAFLTGWLLTRPG